MATREPGPEHVIILVHGIRDFALWQANIRSALEEAGFIVEVTNYGRFNLLQFIAPFQYFRKKAIDKIWNQMRIIKQNHEGARLSVIAHSFGTFVVAHLMLQNFDIKFHRVIFCGSVLNYDFPFEQIQDRFTRPVINEVGTRDIWPAIAESITTGYGSAGTYGFKRPLVRDRWHIGARHGFFLDEAFCKRFWNPFLRDGTLRGAQEPEPPVFWVQLLSIFKLKYLLSAAAIFLCSYWMYENATLVVDRTRVLLDRLYGDSIKVPNPLTVGTVQDLDALLKQIEAKKGILGEKKIKRISIELTTTLITSDNGVVPPVTRRFMNERIVRTLLFLNDRDLSFVWRSLPTNADLSYLDLSNTNLAGVTFKHAFLIYTNFKGAQLDDAVFDDCWIRNVDFSGASLSNINFSDTDWFNALNIPTHARAGWPEPYTEWADIPVQVAQVR